MLDEARTSIADDDPLRALGLLRRHVTGDFGDIVPDLAAGNGCRLVDQRDGTTYLDMSMYFSSAPLGHGHPALRTPEFEADMLAAARVKPSNPDYATVAQARFVTAFQRVLGDPELPLLFFIDGGAMAVENALKVAFDWKTQRNAARGLAVRGWRVLHLAGAFHGRSGYTLSLTNTDREKTRDYPVFDWPRIPSPVVHDPALWSVGHLLPDETAAVESAKDALDRYPGEIACFVYEPIQGEGGDRHLRPMFIRELESLCIDRDVLTVADEVQTGGGLTGRAWAYQDLQLRPDLVAFGKRTQVCGVMGGRRVLEIPANAFRSPSRISSTWGGSLVDMVRCTHILRVVEEEDLLANAWQRGRSLLAGLRYLAADHPDFVSQARGRGLMCAITLPDTRTRDLVIAYCRHRYRTLFLPCGTASLRWRPPLTVTEADIAEALAALRSAVREVAADPTAGRDRTAACAGSDIHGG